jgi:hypothetical protein
MTGKYSIFSEVRGNMGVPDDAVKNAAYKEVALYGYLLTERDLSRVDHDCLLCAVSSLWREE